MAEDTLPPKSALNVPVAELADGASDQAVDSVISTTDPNKISPSSGTHSDKKYLRIGLVVVALILVTCLVWIGKIFLPIIDTSPLSTEFAKNPEVEMLVQDSAENEIAEGEPSVSFNEQDKIVMIEFKGIAHQLSETLFGTPDQNLMFESRAGELSPNESSLAVLADVGLTPVALFIFEFATEEVKFVEYCDQSVPPMWSPSGRYLSCIGMSSDVGPNTLMLYDVEQNLVLKCKDDGIPQMILISQVAWVSDEKIEGEYTILHLPSEIQTKTDLDTTVKPFSFSLNQCVAVE